MAGSRTQKNNNKAGVNGKPDFFQQGIRWQEILNKIKIMNRLISNFWDFFSAYSKSLLHLDVKAENGRKLFDRLNAMLHAYCKDLDCIITQKKTGAELTVTAHGNPYLFKEAELLVHFAPLIYGWKITAFLQPDADLDKYRKGTDEMISFNGISLRISEIYFLPLEIKYRPNNLGIRVFIKNYLKHSNNKNLQEALYMQIEHLIGEKSFANEVAFIEIAQLKEEMKQVTIPLFELGLYIQTFKKSFPLM